MVEGRSLATEQDFSAEKLDAVVDTGSGRKPRPAKKRMMEYAEYVDPKYAEKVMASKA